MSSGRWLAGEAYPDRMARTSRGMSASAVATRISAAAPYWVTDTPITYAIGPATRAPTGIAITEPRAS